jgi:hypothetical protein
VILVKQIVVCLMRVSIIKTQKRWWFWKAKDRKKFRVE